MNVLGLPPTGGNLGLPQARRVLAGVKESSVLWERLRPQDEARMPPLASSEIEPTAVELIGRWIESLR